MQHFRSFGSQQIGKIFLGFAFELTGGNKFFSRLLLLNIAHHVFQIVVSLGGFKFFSRGD